MPNNWKRNTHTLISNFSECKRQCTYLIHRKTVKYGGNFCLPFDCGQTKYCYLVTVAIWSAFHSEFAPKTYTILDWKNSFSMDIVLPISSSIKYDTYCRREATGPRSCSLFVNLERMNRVVVRNLCPLFQCPSIKLLNKLRFSNITIRGKILIEISLINELPER